MEGWGNHADWMNQSFRRPCAIQVMPIRYVTQAFGRLFGGEVTLGELLSHRNAFSLDGGALHLYCYPGDLAAFWAEPDDGISPHYDSTTWGNLGGGYEYSAFNFSLSRVGFPVFM